MLQFLIHNGFGLARRLELALCHKARLVRINNQNVPWHGWDLPLRSFCCGVEDVLPKVTVRVRYATRPGSFGLLENSAILLPWGSRR